MSLKTADKHQKHNKSRESGHSVIEVALLAPWIFFLFVGALDFGFYSYAAITTQNAARIAAFHNATSPEAAADAYAAQTARADACAEMIALPNVGNGCPSSAVQVSVAPQPFTGADGAPASQVTVTYQTVPLIPIPGILPGQLTIARSVEVKL